MNIADFDFSLPEDLIAQVPTRVRDQSRLLVVDRRTQTFAHHTFAEIGRFLPAGGTLLRNNASVLPARLRGKRPSGGAVECLLLAPGEADEWWCLVRPGRKLPVGARFAQRNEWEAEIVDIAPDGKRLVRFQTLAAEPFLATVNRVGEMPLPPYIRRSENDARAADDRERYQTVYAQPDKQVAAAAPTAGLHFTPELEADLRAAGFTFTDLTLHVGLGTFQPIKTDRVEDHPIHTEIYEIPPEAQKRLLDPAGRPRIAVGTTATRTAEDYLRKTAAAPADPSVLHTGEADLFIYPPYRFLGTDALITNFHLPRSSLLCLVAAFLAPGETSGVDWLLELYAEAIRERYRFFSYGDAMLIL